MPFSILLADDHRIFREALKVLIERSEDFRVIGEAGDGLEAVRFAKRHRPELVLMDLDLPELSGVEATIEILRHCPESKVILLAGTEAESSLLAALRSGSRGVILKSASAENLLEALRTVAAGGSYTCPQVASRLQASIQNGQWDPKPLPVAVATLAPRELQVFGMVAAGKTSKEIAVLLDLGLHTVRSYRKAMMKKLGVTNVAELTRLAVSAGLRHGASEGAPVL
jgi:DNA-binding NarL/FixJ family response regulator